MSFLDDVSCPLHVTATGTNAIATCTLPAAGAGLFHYICAINIQRGAAAAIVGTAILTITSTNLPGSPAWTVGNAIILGGTITDLSYAPTKPLKSLVANTATTIVYPAAGTTATSRINVSYYVGP